MKFILRQKFLLISFVILVGNCLLGYALYQSNNNLIDSDQWVKHTENVITQSDNIFSTGKDLKTSSRDYIITHDSLYLRQFYHAVNTVFADIKELKRLTSNNPAQQPRIDSLQRYMSKRYAFAVKTIACREHNHFEKTIEYAAAQNDQYYATPISRIIDSIKQAEGVLLKQRKAVSERTLIVYNQLSILVFILMTAFIIVLLITVGNYLLQNKEKEKRAAELAMANVELTFQNDEKQKRAGELVIANKELSYQSSEKKKRAGELVIANKELTYQSVEKEKRAAELVIADEELVYQNSEKGKRAAELVIANEELSYQNEEKEKRASELIIANDELWYQNGEKEKRAAELVVANDELLYQNKEKEKRAMELAFANEELLFQNDVRKMAERNLSQSESRLKEAQALSKIGNFEVDVLKGTEIWSDEMYHIYGIEKGRFMPSKELLFSFIHPDDAEEVIAAMKRSSKSFNAFAAEFRFIKQDGTLRYGYSEARFEWNTDKELIRIYGIIQDVTERKLADIERKKMLNDLMLRNNDLEQFAYIISHNLRAPVANIIGASSALNDEDVSAEDKDILNRAIKTSVMRLDDVVQDLNHILQVKGSINETRELVRFSGLINDIKTSIADLLKNDVQITYDFDELDELLTIKAYLYSIFYNLITNSIKYCQAKVACGIEIKSLVVKNTLFLTFKDNGLGINLDKKGDQVFGLYKRFHENTEGKGMGLYMVKTQVETLGGKIGIKSAENVGTEFTIEFEV